MTNELILKKAIDKAIKNGYKVTDNYKYWDWTFVLKESLFDIIFSHDFAKHFWGEKLIGVNIDKYLDDNGERATHGTAGAYIEFILPAWQYHLQQLVLEEKPLKYIEKFLKVIKLIN